MFFINILLIVHNISFKLIESINSKLTISLYLSDKYDNDSIDVKDLKSDIKKQFPEIEYTYKSKDILLKELEQKDPELVKIIEKDNPLPNTITIQNVKINDYKILNDIIETKLYILSDINKDTNDYFSHYTNQYKRIIKIINILNILQI
jgi:cell division protein FtsX